jgi:transposase
MRAVAGPSGLAIRCVVLDGDTVILEAAGTAETAACPGCGTPSKQVHAWYERRPLDLPWRGATVRLIVRVRRFWCHNPLCVRETFAEAFGEALPAQARRTAEATTYLTVVAQVAGGEAGARLAQEAGLPTSPDTLLRLQRAAALPAETGETPRVLGVDDLALRRGRTYATILVDMETHRTVELLQGRDAKTLATWLRAHPGVEIVVRDRAGAYAEGAKQGAPEAVQVADRFHLLQNATEAFDRLLRTRNLEMDLAGAPTDGADVPGEDGQPDGGAQTSPTTEATPVAPVVPERPKSARQEQQAVRRAARIERWQQVHTLHEGGQSLRGIARTLGINRRTARQLLHAEAPLKNQITHPRPGGLTSPTLQPYVSYLQDRWQAGCTNVSQLFRELQALGYMGSRTLLHQALQAWKGPRPPKAERQQQRRRQNRRAVRWLCVRPQKDLSTHEFAELERLLARNPELATGHELLEQFRELVMGGNVDALDGWLSDARACGLPTFASLATGITEDRAAVAAALTTRWSNGLVEGRVHKVKLIKRQGYGRATFALLRRRVLAA